MCTSLAKLAIGLSATMATGFYYLAAAPPASAIDVCGPGNFSSACVPDSSASPQPPASLRDQVPQLPIVASPLATPEPIVESPLPLAIPEPVPSVPPIVVESPIVEPTVPPIVSPPPVIELQPPTDPPILVLPPVQPPTVIPNPIAPSPAPIAPPPPTFPNIYTNTTAVRATAIPEPGTVVALLLTGAGIICSGKRRNKQVGQQR